ncbi:unnamed protein product, partial [Iphiclides podalirius]
MGVVSEKTELLLKLEDHLDKKAIKGYLIGYDEDGYRVWITDGKKNRLVRSRDVIFDESPLSSEDAKTETGNENVINEFQLKVSQDCNTSRDEIIVERTVEDDIHSTEPVELTNDDIEPIEPEREAQVETDNVYDPLPEEPRESLELEREDCDEDSNIRDDEFHDSIDQSQEQRGELGLVN